MKIDVASRGEIRDVALRMRDRDLQEISAICPFDTREEIADRMVGLYGGRSDVLCAGLEDKPICIGAAIEGRPNVVSLLFFATDDFPLIGLSITRFIRSNLFPRLARAGVHRIEAISLDGYDEVHAWLRAIGLQAETGPLLGYGKRGESFVQFARIQDVRPAGA